MESHSRNCEVWSLELIAGCATVLSELGSDVGDAD